MDHALITAMASGAAALLSGIALYLNRLQRAKLDIDSGEEALFYAPSDGGLGLYMNVSISNSGAVSGVLRRLIISVRHDKEPDNRFLAEWRSFFKILDQDGRKTFQMIDSAHAVSIEGGGSKHLIIKFWWPNWADCPMTLGAGSLKIQGWAWDQHRRLRSPIFVSNVTVTNEIHHQLEHNRRYKDTSIVRAPISRDSINGRKVGVAEMMKLFQKQP